MTKLKLPVDFGLEDLYQQNNNNAAFILADGERFAASSLMLGFHSPVIKERYINEGILDIDAEEFPRESVKVFVEAMYCGNLKATRDNFRNVNKLCHVFKVTWMSTECLEYFESAIESAVGLDELRVLFGEAVYLSEHGRSGALLEVWKQKVGVTHDDFIEECLKHPEVTDFTLDRLIELIDDHSVFVRHIGEILTDESRNELDMISKHLLLNINLVGCIERGHGDMITKVFDVLLDNMDSADWRLFNKLHRTMTKNIIQHRKMDSEPDAKQSKAIISRTSASFPNVFCPVVNYPAFLSYTGSPTKTIKNVAKVSYNLYMVFEFIDFFDIGYSNVTASIIRRLDKLRIQNKWSPLHREFVKRLQSMKYPFIMNNDPLIASEKTSIRVVSEKVTTDWDLLTTTARYKFHMIVPGQFPTDNDSECIFFVHVTGGTFGENPRKFNIQLGLDNKNPGPGSLQDGLSAKRMHLTIELQNFRYSTEWIAHGISWCRRPSFMDDGDTPYVLWGRRFTAENKLPARLVVYYSVGAS